MKTIRMRVEGMSCGHCVRAVENALRSRPGVRSVSVRLDEGSAEVEYDEHAVAPEQLAAAVEEEGYTATPASAS